MHQSRRGLIRPSGPKRLTAWGLGPGTTTVATTSTTSDAIIGSGAVPLVEGLTVVRVRGEFQAFLIAATGADDGFGCALGIGVANAQAFAAGIVSLNTPLDEADWDGWLYHRFFSLHSSSVIDGSVAADADSINARSVAIRFEIDSKAMRKLSDEMVLYMALSVTLGGTAQMKFVGNIRILLKLP